MAMTFTDMNKLNLSGLNEVITLTVGLAGEISKGITVMNGIANNTPVVSLTALDKALKLSAGCGATTYYDKITDKVKYYNHAPIELPLEICLQSLWGKMVAKGINLDDNFSETELAGFIQAEVLKVLESDLLRLAWLDGDVKEEKTGYGIFKRGGIIAQHIASAEDQGALTLDTAGVLAALRACVDGQRPDQLDGSEFFVTSNVMRLYKNLLQDRTNDMAFSTLLDGKPEYYFEGYKIHELRHVSNAAKVDGNHDAFIALTPMGNIQVALESAAPSIAPFIQDAKSRNYYSNTVFAADAMLVTPEFMQLWLHASV